jgi:hypothetical protein
VQALNAAPSRLQANVLPVSVDVNANEAELEEDGFGGVEVIVVLGATVSTVHVNDAGVASVFPVASIAFTWKVWDPSASVVNETGLVQALNAAPSSAHWNVEPASLEAKEKLALADLLGFAGVVVIVVCGAVTSSAR